MRSAIHRVLLVAALGNLLLANMTSATQVGLADDTESGEPAAPAKMDWSDDVKKSAEQILVFANADDKEPLAMKTVYKWYNPARAKDAIGQRLVLLYLHEGRPVASCKVYPTGKSFVHTLISLTDLPLVARQQDSVIWSPPTSAPTFKILVDADPPRQTPNQRRVQLKSLAREFSMETGPGEAKRQSSNPELRLLPQPLYRYEVQDDGQDGLVDGAAFCFVANGGNPQALLLIEAVRNDDELSWQYGFSRRTFAQLKAFHMKQEVWFGKFLPVRQRTSTNTFFKLALPVAK